jgi:hypothetical protein
LFSKAEISRSKVSFNIAIKSNGGQSPAQKAIWHTRSTSAGAVALTGALAATSSTIVARAIVSCGEAAESEIGRWSRGGGILYLLEARTSPVHAVTFESGDEIFY